MAKRYKPGQFCSLGGKLYRVKRRAIVGSACAECGYKCFGNDRDTLFSDCAIKLPSSCYPVEIKPKRQG